MTFTCKTKKSERLFEASADDRGGMGFPEDRTLKPSALPPSLRRGPQLIGIARCPGSMLLFEAYIYPH